MRAATRRTSYWRGRWSPPMRSFRSRTARRRRSTPASTALIQPGGSVRDAEVIAACDEAGAAMVVHRPPPLPPLSGAGERHARAARASRLLRRGRQRRQSARGVPRRLRGAGGASAGDRRATSASPRRCSSTTPSAARCASSPRRWSCRSPGIRWSARAWLLARERGAVAALRPPAGEVPVRVDGGLTYAAGRPEWSPPFEFVQVELAGRGRGARRASGGLRTRSGSGRGSTRPRGSIRERVFAPRSGSPRTRRPAPRRSPRGAARARADIRQGAGSRILARPLGDGMVEIGGRVELDEVREHAVEKWGRWESDPELLVVSRTSPEDIAPSCKCPRGVMDNASAF